MSWRVGLVAAGALLAALGAKMGQAGEVRQSYPVAPGNRLEVIADDREHDINVFRPDGSLIQGMQAFTAMRHVDLAIWVAGNQYFAMPDVIHAFQNRFPAAKRPSVALITLPPGKIVSAMLNGGWRFRDKTLRVEPDVWGQVALEPAQQLKRVGLANNYRVYIHNQLVLVVAKGNPKRVTGISSLARPDLRIMLPNPVKEGIMTEYARKVLEQHDLWDKLSDGKLCESCTGAPNVWFTSVHHREIPAALQAGKTDVGIVWATEVQNARKQGANVDSIALPPEDSLINSVNYYIGSVPGSPHAQLARDYINFIASPAGQQVYTKFGFLPATPADLKPKPL